MNKAYNKFGKKNSIFWVIIGLILFNLTSCGIDTVYVIEAPWNNLHDIEYTNESDYANKYFEFATYEYEPDLDFKFLGTDVYYCIYNNTSDILTEITKIQTLADSETSSSSAADYLVSKYKRLKCSGNNYSHLIPHTKGDDDPKNVKIRLTNYLDTYPAYITVDDEDYGIPLRNNSTETLTFDFGRTLKNSDINKVPVSDDEDVHYSSTTTSEGKWYVAMFAVAVGRDTSFTEFYSTPLYLGSVTIDANSEDN